MKIIFKSKLGPELVIPISLILGGISVLFIAKGIWPGILIIAGVSAFIMHTFMTTEYIIDQGKLQVKSGLFFNKLVDIQSIRKIVETKTPLSSPALSIDRIEVFYNKFDSVIISPKDKREFIEKLLQINDRIEVKYKESASH
jgi:hypothetical protein